MKAVGRMSLGLFRYVRVINRGLQPGGDALRVLGMFFREGQHANHMIRTETDHWMTLKIVIDDSSSLNEVEGLRFWMILLL